MDGPFGQASQESTSLLRQRMRALLRTDADFVAFTLDHFPTVYQRMSDGMERVVKENLLFSLESSDSILVALNSRSQPDPSTTLHFRMRNRIYFHTLFLTVLLFLLGTFIFLIYRKNNSDVLAEKASTPTLPMNGPTFSPEPLKSSPIAEPSPLLAPSRPKIKAKLRSTNQPKPQKAIKQTTSELIQELDRPPPDH